jgi:hypothetical protein
MQTIAAGGDNKLSDALANDSGDAVCLAGCDLRVFVDHVIACDSDAQRARIGITLAAGDTASPQTHYDSTGDYELAGSIDTLISFITDKRGAVYLNRIVASLLFSCGQHSDFIMEIGLNKNINQDNCGKYEDGWFKTGCEYYGNGFEGFVNPFIWNKRTKGCKLAYVAKGLECFAHYGNKADDAANDNSDAVNTTYSQGIFNSDTPAACELGAKYRVNGSCPADLWLVCQQINNGAKIADTAALTSDVYASANSADDSGSVTPAATLALRQAAVKSQYVNSLAGGCCSQFQGIDMSASLACANLENDDNDDARILKWQVGCVSKCKPLKCLPKTLGMGAQAYGLNVGTPAYLSQDITRNSQTTKADETPLVCEAYCLFNVCGFNLPVFVDFLNHKEGTDSGTSGVTVDTENGNAFILGCRTSKIFGIECDKDGARCTDKLILDCSKVEGGLEGEDEDEE